VKGLRPTSRAAYQASFDRLAEDHLIREDATTLANARELEDHRFDLVRIRVDLRRSLRRCVASLDDAPQALMAGRVREVLQARQMPMNRAERELYDDVTRYLLEPGIIAFQCRHRQLLLLSFTG
jgi:hypothetical protein